jgi:hypothetical protein
MNRSFEDVPPREWIRTNSCEILVANHMPLEWENVWSKFDAQATARMFREADVQKVCYVAKDAYGFSYYPTKIGVTHPHLSRDVVGEFTAALKRWSIHRILYFYPGVDRVHFKTHPEWRITDPKAPATDKYATMCFNSPYLDEAALPQIRELALLYDIDGVFLDIITQPYLEWNCTCSFCREKYAREVGGEIPKDDKDPAAFVYRKWLNQSMEALFRRFYTYLASIKKDPIIEYNLGWRFTYPVDPPDFVPFITMDTPTPDMGLYSWNFSLEARYLSNFKDKVFSCMNTRMGSWGDFTLREVDALIQECAIMLAGGGKTYLADLPYPDGRFEQAVYSRLAVVNNITENNNGIGRLPVSDTAVLHSADTIWSKAPLKPWTEWRGGPPYYPACGAHKALIEGHVQFGILNSRMLTDSLKLYSALVLPDQRVLGEDDVNAIRNFVREGGVVVASYETGARDSGNRKLKDLSLSDVFGVHLLETVDSSCCYLRGKPELRRWGIPAMDIQVNGPYTRIETTTADTLLELVPPYDGIMNGTPPPALLPIGPGVTINRYREGSAIYIAPELFGAYFRADTPVLRKLILWALGLVHPPEKRTIVVENTPINVEMFYNEDSDYKFVHFINYSGDKRDTGTPQVQDFTEVHGIVVKVRLEKKPASLALMADGNKDFSYSDGWMTFEARPLKIHDVYRIEL